MRRGVRAVGTLVLVLLVCGAGSALAAADSPLAWTNIHVKSSQMLGVSCPSTSLCVAVDSGGDVVTSTNPTGGAGAWTVTHVAAVNFRAVSCPSASLCVATDATGDVATSTDPTGGAGAWTVTHVDEAFFNQIHSISCPSSSLCVAGDGEGDVVTSTDPTGGAGAWTTTQVDNLFPAIYGVSCPSGSFCVATADNGDVLTSTDPTGGAVAWSIAKVAGISLRGVSCPSVSLCVSTSANSGVVTSTDPTGGAGAWTFVPVADSGFTLGVSCPSVSLCVAVDGTGDVVTSTHPTGGAGAWTVTHVDDAYPYLFEGASCPSTSLCVASGDNDVAVGAPPGPPAGGNSSAATPPTVKILSGPPAETASQKATFKFKGVAGGTYRCSIDEGSWSPCASGKTFEGLLPGDHLFRVRETANGLTGPAASYRWTIDLPKSCVLRVARARIYVAPKQHKVRLVIHYTSYRPAQVEVSYDLLGKRGVASLGDTSANFATAGVFRDPETLPSRAFGEVRTAKLFKVQFKIAKTPRSCGRYYTKRITIPRKFSGRTVWFQSDSIFAPELK